MNPRFFLLGLVILLGINTSFAQMLSHVQGELLVRLSDGEDPRHWTLDLQMFEGRPTRLQLKKQVSKPMNIWSYTFDFTTVNELRLLVAVRRHPAVATAQFNHLLAWRNEPNDPGFPDQWQYINNGQSGGTPGADIDIEQAWDITTGGLTAAGDTIVVCVIDDGLDANHEDFAGNVWVNHKEIPNNGIDDDDNGYIDDYRGWNAGPDNDNIYLGGGHGTPVAGIIGARGNNGVGVAGINWNVKLMIVRYASTVESEVLAAYSFPLIHRMRYNETGGEEGAFVVSTNASWGIDFGQPADAPLWCAFYDTLGVHGILNCGATINSNVNVDLQGDLPTGCDSDYLITVTNMNHNDLKITSAGYGATTIDLGAFGQGTWTAASGNSYSGFGGTSGATPHVTGTVGLLYSAPCPSLIELAKASPGAAALLVKQYILDGVDPNESLEGITVTGGRLNVNNSLRLLMSNCGPCPPPVALGVSAIIDTTANLSWVVTDSINTTTLRWRPLGDLVWTTVTGATAPYTLTGLSACADYEFQVRGFCDSDTLAYTPSHIFRTDGCCELPANLTIAGISEDQAAVFWDDVLAAEGFTIQIRPVGADTWDSYTVDGQALPLDELASCTEYELQIRTLCANGDLPFGPSTFFQTRGCGPCQDGDYCTPSGMNTEDEWIDSISLHTLQWASGSDGGYGNYTELPELVLEAGLTYPITLTPGYQGFAFPEDFSVWIDANQDGFFGNNEIVFATNNTSNGMVTGALTVPFDALPGGTRLRVVMQYQQVTGNCNFPPGSYGEVEDYCLQITPATTCYPPSGLATAFVAQTLARLEWSPSGNSDSYVVEYRTESDTLWQTQSTAATNLLMTGLTACTEYVVKVKSLCSMLGESEDVAGPILFTTTCPPVNTATSNLPDDVSFELFPNPFQEQLRVALDLPARYRQPVLTLINSLGQPVRLIPLNTGLQQRTIDGVDLPAGLYLLRLQLDGKTEAIRKVIKLN